MKQREINWGLVAAALFLGTLGTQPTHAASFQRQILLEAYKDFYQYPRVHSYANAEVVDSAGWRIYTQLILGHNVVDYNEQRTIFSAQIVTESGYANSTTRDLSTGKDMLGDYEHCYGAVMSAHANAYNLHEQVYAPDDCIGPAPPEPPPFEKSTPILIDLEMDGFHLSGPAPAVKFDLDGDGQLDSTAWTSAGEDDAFLCMDRNGNGVIDDGKELFGSATPLTNGETTESGYYPLAELDEPEADGNSDGQVDAEDPMFGRLCAWIDKNRDGVSQRREIFSLAQVGVVAFERRFKKMHRMDDFGNLFRYTSRVHMRSAGGGVTSWPTYDVIFAVPK